MFAKFCNDFFLTPSDLGMSLTKNMNINEVVKIPDDYKELMEIRSTKRPKVGNIEGGTIWSEMTLVFDTNSRTKFSQTYWPAKSFLDKATIQLQVHQAKEFPNMIKESTYDDFSEPISLTTGYEYVIDVYPYGQVSTKEFKSLNYNQRQCYLETETDQTGIFKVYTEKNCRYSCHVRLASKKCGCRPWDFIDYLKMEECDVFGRVCFSNAIKIITKSPEELCGHCKDECDFMKFKKKVRSEKIAKYEGSPGKYFEYRSGKVSGSKAFIDLLMDVNKTIIDDGLRNIFDNFNSQTFVDQFPNENNGELIIVHLRFKQPEVNVIEPKYTVFDMIGTFGGQLGILEKLTGASFLGFVNLLLILFKLMFSSHRSE